MAKKPFVPVVAVLNMKGGVGKTTLSATLFRKLFQRKRIGTLLVDLDPQFNLTQALFTRSAYDELKKEGKTILAAMEPPSEVGLFEIKTSTLPPPKASELVETFYYFPKSNPIKNLSIVPGDFGLVKYSLMDDNKKLKAVKSRFLKFIDSAKDEYGLICIDCNPSSSFLTLCALHACTHILVPVRPDRYSILGLEMLNQFVKSLPTISPKPEFIIVENGVPRSGNANFSLVDTELRGHPDFGGKTLVNVIKESGLLKAKTNYTGFATDRSVPWSATLGREVDLVVDELALKLGV